MEQHPVPRNISGFQFKLIGDMTLRQFGYLAGGIIIAFLIFKTAPLPTFLRFLFAAVPAFSGFLFAFLPIQERPLDKWLVLFIRSIYAPTQFLWQKEGVLPSVLYTSSTARITTLSAVHAAAHEDAQQKLKKYLETLPSTPHQALNRNEKAYMDKTLSLFATTAALNVQPIVTPIPPVSSIPMQTNISAPPVIPVKTNPPVSALPPHLSDKPPLEDAYKSASNPSFKDQPIIAPQVVSQPEVVPSPSSPIQEYDALQKKLQELTTEKERLAKELELLKQSSEKESMRQSPSVVVKPALMDETAPTIKAVTAKNAVDEIGMPSLSMYPNLIVGVVKDAQRKVLPNILITIKDKNGVPLRALKTNKLGQFAAATPLPNGLYFIEIEDPLKRFTFDMAEVTLAGKVFFPIEVTAKSQKEAMREQLSKALFGNPAV
jgi:hypothetical protein